MPSMLEYRSSKLDDIMVAILADAGKGCPRPHLSSFPGLLNGPGKFVNINTHFTLAPYEVGLGLQCKTKVRMPCGCFHMLQMSKATLG